MRKLVIQYGRQPINVAWDSPNDPTDEDIDQILQTQLNKTPPTPLRPEWMAKPPEAMPVPTPEPTPSDALEQQIKETASRHGVDPSLVMAMISSESGFKPDAVSSKGAGGLMQLMPPTAKELGVTDVHDPQQNLEGGTRYIKQLLDKYNGNVAKAVAAYNAGPGAVDRKGGENFPETAAYVAKVLKRYKSYQGSAPATLPPPPIYKSSPVGDAILPGSSGEPSYDALNPDDTPRPTSALEALDVVSLPFQAFDAPFNALARSVKMGGGVGIKARPDETLGEMTRELLVPEKVSQPDLKDPLVQLEIAESGLDADTWLRNWEAQQKSKVSTVGRGLVGKGIEMLSSPSNLVPLSFGKAAVVFIPSMAKSFGSTVGNALAARDQGDEKTALKFFGEAAAEGLMLGLLTHGAATSLANGKTEPAQEELKRREGEERQGPSQPIEQQFAQQGPKPPISIEELLGLPSSPEVPRTVEGQLQVKPKPKPFGWEDLSRLAPDERRASTAGDEVDRIFDEVLEEDAFEGGFEGWQTVRDVRGVSPLDREPRTLGERLAQSQKIPGYAERYRQSATKEDPVLEQMVMPTRQAMPTPQQRGLAESYRTMIAKVLNAVRPQVTKAMMQKPVEYGGSLQKQEAYYGLNVEDAFLVNPERYIQKAVDTALVNNKPLPTARSIAGRIVSTILHELGHGSGKRLRLHGDRVQKDFFTGEKVPLKNLTGAEPTSTLDEVQSSITATVTPEGHFAEEPTADHFGFDTAHRAIKFQAAHDAARALAKAFREDPRLTEFFETQVQKAFNSHIDRTLGQGVAAILFGEPGRRAMAEPNNIKDLPGGENILKFASRAEQQLETAFNNALFRIKKKGEITFEDRDTFFEDLKGIRLEHPNIPETTLQNWTTKFDLLNKELVNKPKETPTELHGGLGAVLPSAETQKKAVGIAKAGVTGLLSTVARNMISASINLGANYVGALPTALLHRLAAARTANPREAQNLRDHAKIYTEAAKHGIQGTISSAAATFGALIHTVSRGALSPDWGNRTKMQEFQDFLETTEAAGVSRKMAGLGNPDLAFRSKAEKIMGLAGILQDRFFINSVMATYLPGILKKYGARDVNHLRTLFDTADPLLKDRMNADFVMMENNAARVAWNQPVSQQNKVGQMVMKLEKDYPLFSFLIAPFPGSIFGNMLPGVVEGMPGLNKLMGARYNNSIEHAKLMTELQYQMPTQDRAKEIRAKMNKLRRDGIYDTGELHIRSLVGPLAVAAAMAYRYQTGDDGTDALEIKGPKGGTIATDPLWGWIAPYIVLGDYLGHKKRAADKGEPFKYEARPGRIPEPLAKLFVTATGSRYGPGGPAFQLLSEIGTGKLENVNSAEALVNMTAAGAGRMFGAGGLPGSVFDITTSLFGPPQTELSRTDLGNPFTAGISGFMAAHPLTAKPLPKRIDWAGFGYEKILNPRSAGFTGLTERSESPMGNMLKSNFFIKPQQFLPSRSENPIYDEMVLKNWTELGRPIFESNYAHLREMDKRTQAAWFENHLKPVRNTARFLATIEYQQKYGKAPEGVKQDMEELWREYIADRMTGRSKLKRVDPKKLSPPPEDLFK